MQVAALNSGLEDGVGARVALLVGQGITLGVMLALLVITASALFLTTFGAPALPYVYIAVAFLGALVSFGFARLQRRRTFPQVAMATTAVVALFFFLCWLGLARAAIRWIPFALIAAFPLLLQVGFIILGGQAGRLLDVRQIKRLFPRVVTGFVVGFIIGGAITPILVTWLGDTINVVPVIALVALLWLALEFVTSRRFPAAFQPARIVGRRQPQRTWPQLLAKRFVRLIFVYQMLAAMVTQLADFLVLAQAGERYRGSEALAQFFSTYTVILNSADLFFLLLLAGYFLSRFGLRAGLLANPVVGTVIFLATAVAGILLGSASFLFFGLVVLARILNITLTDGTTRTSVNAAYQALPTSERILVQTGAEGIGAPLALGMVGVILLLFNATGGLTIMSIVFLTLLLALLWAAAGIWLYRDYTGELLHTIRRRALGEAGLMLADKASLAALAKLLQSDEPGTVRLALDTMETARLDGLDTALRRLLGHPQPAVRADVLARIERRQVAAAQPEVIALVSAETDPVVQGTAIRTWCALGEAESVEQIIPYLTNPESEIRRGALVGLLRYGGIPGVLAAGAALAGREHSAATAERRLLAQVIGEVKAPNFYRPLLALLQDEDLSVRQAALVAAGQVQHPKLLPLLVDNLALPATRSAAMAALQAYGEAILPLVAGALAAETAANRDTTLRLVRLSGQSGGSQVIDLLLQHLDHPDNEIRQAILVALNRRRYRAEAKAAPLIRRRLHREVEYAAHLLLARQDLGEEEALAPLQRALGDELALARRRSFLLLSFIYDARALLQAETRLARDSGPARALALEFLDVTLAAAEKALLLPWLKPRLTAAERAQKLAHLFDLPSRPRERRLQEMIANESGLWSQPWLKACAIYAAGSLSCVSCVAPIKDALSYDNAVVQETAVWALSSLAPEHFTRLYTESH